MEWLLRALLSHRASFTSNTFSISAIKSEPEAAAPPQMQVCCRNPACFHNPRKEEKSNPRSKIVMLSLSLSHTAYEKHSTAQFQLEINVISPVFAALIHISCSSF